MRTERARWALASLVAFACLIAPAVWNRFPILQYDTGGYLARWYEGILVPSRAVVYGLLLNAGQWLDFWPVVAVQAALTVWVIALTLRAHGLARPGILAGVIALLSLLTTLPWLSAILLTDIFCGLSVLALYLLVMRANVLARAERGGLAVVVALGAATHSATLAVLLALLLCALIACLARRIAFARWRDGVLAVAFGALLVFTANYAVSGRLAWTPGGFALSFGRMLQDGIVKKYLDEHCPDERYRLCGHKDELPHNADEWFWGSNLFDRLGRFDGLGKEMAAITRDSVAAYPGLQLRAALLATARQLIAVESGEGVVDSLWHTYGIIERYTPWAAGSMRGARQQRDEIDVDELNPVHYPAALLAMALLPAIVLLRRRRGFTRVRELAAVVMLAILANAAVCGVFSNPHDRYGARMVWLASLAVLIAALRLRRDPAKTWTLTALAMTLMILAPALWNGFPFIFPDTGGYLERPLTGTLELGRSALYGVFLAAGLPLSFWPVIVAQAGLIVWLVTLTLRAHALARPAVALAIIALLTLASAMPWYADTLMPDILLPAAVLSLYLLAFRGDGLHLAERIALIAVVAIAIASHMGTLALCLGLLLALALLRFLPLPRARLTLPALATATGLLLAPLSSFAVSGQFAFTPGGETFVFGRLVQDGIVARYLADRCPDSEIRLCAFKDRLPKSADDWLWAPGNPAGELGGWRAYQPEARRIILDTLRLYPAMHARTALRATLDQLLMMRTEVSVNPDYNAPALGALQEEAPQVMPQLAAARQQAAPFDLAMLNVAHVALAAISIAALIIVIFGGRQSPVVPQARALAALVLLALLGNAAICGIFSNPVDRYQSRLVWLAPLALFIALGSRRRPQ